MTKYFTKAECDTIVGLFNTNDYNNWYLAIDLIKTHPKYKYLKKLMVRTTTILRFDCKTHYKYYHWSYFRTKRTLENSLKSWENLLDWTKIDEITGFSFIELINFVQRRTFNK